ncbi:hypothetical protein AWB78_04186 [Caballeronia calidae]|uniref:Lipoprotein n=1 Tax=Caballeronia calidae TaxID=1777139 RepID=A0A158CNW1_9BURK|nr:hypothetical protein [Caballeronia calidae]SAK84044.1 hypothetical protein AWB78_04186 [Caballeronia calidae]
MSTVPGRHVIVARFILCACAIVCACGKPDVDASSSVAAARIEPSALPATSATSELQDWAKQATGGPSDQTARRAMVRAASEPLATPVIHTVD